MFEIISLENGVRIVAEKLPYVRSVSVGIWAGSGTRHEPPELNGISHFIEHMLFKGTKTRDASELAELMDMLGGEVNAFTTSECTCYYGRVLDTELPRAVGLLSDMFFNSRFDEECVNVERGVINEEINMSMDEPEEFCIDRLLLGVFDKTPLGMPILGTRETLKGINSETLRSYMKSHYTGDGIVISLAGNFTDGDIDNIKAVFSACAAAKRPQSGESRYRPHISAAVRQTEQSHIAIGFPGLSYRSDRRFALALLNGIVGANMSSRLFQRVREKLGLCYSVYSLLATHEDTGAFVVYVGTGKETERQAVVEIGAEISRLVRDGITKEELSKVRTQIKSGMLMSLESTSARMTHMGKNLLLAGRVPTADEIAAKYDAVTEADVMALAAEMFRPENVSISAVTQEGEAGRYLEWINEGLSGNAGK